MKKFTGYWTFFCNPRKWEIEKFLLSNDVYDTFTVTDYQKEWFKKGQLGVIRVGHDHRTKKQLAGRKPLQRGIYAIVEILSTTDLKKEPTSKYWIDSDEAEKKRYRVNIKYIKNLLRIPIPLESSIFKDDNYDPHLIEGFQASSMPLNSNTFEAIVNLLGGSETLAFDFIDKFDDSIDSIEELDKDYIDAVPEVKERVSHYIERGSIAKDYKKIAGYKCQICDALDKNPYTFKKSNGEYYVETHHIVQVSELVKGSLGSRNLLAVCPNHHRQLHYGNVDILENNDEFIVLGIDNRKIKVDKFS